MSKLQYLVLALIICVITIVFGTIYITQQQALRIGANDPQIQIAQDTASALDDGSLSEGFPSGKVDMAKSLAPFIIIYDKSGNAVGGTGYLDGKIPKIPIGALENANGRDYSSVTWQPKNGVRIASVSVSAKKYFILSGRSLKEVEKRAGSLLNFVLLGWVTTILLIFLGEYMYHRLTAVKKGIINVRRR